MRCLLTLFLMITLLPGCVNTPIEEVDTTGQTSLPASIRLPLKQALGAKALFEGGLIYTCLNLAEKGKPSFYDWEETGTQGALTFDDGTYGQHEGQSFTWKVGHTTLQGKKIHSWSGNSRSDAPWTLYKTVGSAGENRLTYTNWIQRINTQGGAIPTVACNASFLGSRHAVRTSAYFLFWQDLSK